MGNSKIILVGGGAFARELLSWILDASDATPLPPVTGFLDDNADAFTGFPGSDVKWLGSPLSYQPEEGDLFAIAIGDTSAKALICAALAAKGGRFLTVIHPSAIISRSAKLGAGVIVGPNSYIATHAMLGDYVCVNSLSGIGHDAVVGASATISSQVDVTGGVTVAEEVFIGSGARLLPKISVGARTRIGAGAVVVRSVKPDTTMFAKPAGKL
jgi:sugar O-acyltransferase (sialic acid O-acetyltransferase NeuD family)